MGKALSMPWLLDQDGHPILSPGYVATLDEVVSPSVTLPSGMRSLPSWWVISGRILST